MPGTGKDAGTAEVGFACLDCEKKKVKRICNALLLSSGIERVQSRI